MKTTDQSVASDLSEDNKSDVAEIEESNPLSTQPDAKFFRIVVEDEHTGVL